MRQTVVLNWICCVFVFFRSVLYFQTTLCVFLNAWTSVKHVLAGKLASHYAVSSSSVILTNIKMNHNLFYLEFQNPFSTIWIYLTYLSSSFSPISTPTLFFSRFLIYTTHIEGPRWKLSTTSAQDRILLFCFVFFFPVTSILSVCEEINLNKWRNVQNLKWTSAQ